MNSNPFDSSDYKEIIRREIASHSERGYHSKLARAAGCQSSYLSQVLNGHVHLTADQASGICQFWRLSDEIEEYFFLSVQLARAASPRLKSFLKNKMSRLKQQHLDIAKRVRGSRVSETREEAVYYSAWFWSAIHVIASIPEYRTAVAIAERLKLSPLLVENCLNDLHKMGLLEKKNDRWIVTAKNLHLPRESPLIGVHHMNWRQQAAVRAGTGDSDALHYSVLHALSRDDAEQIKSLMIDVIEKTKKTVEPSPEEEIIYFGLDCFRL